MIYSNSSGEGCGNILFLFLIIAFSSTFHQKYLPSNPSHNIPPLISSLLSRVTVK